LRSALAAVSAHRPAVSDPLFFRPAARAGNSARRPTLTFPEQGRPDRRLCVAWHPMLCCGQRAHRAPGSVRPCIGALSSRHVRGVPAGTPTATTRSPRTDGCRQTHPIRGRCRRPAGTFLAVAPSAPHPITVHVSPMRTVRGGRVYRRAGPGDAWVFPVACGLCHIWHNPQCLRSTP
jgi:hypothetical protein